MATTQRSWDRMAMTQTGTVIGSITSYLSGLKDSAWQRFVHRLRPLLGSHWRAEADFKILQLLFESEFHMPAHFDYVDYIKLVLQDVVVSMANITTYHWMLIILINFIWYIVLQLSGAGLPDDHICLFQVDCAADDDDHRRRQLGGGEDACPCMNSTTPAGPDDIGASETMNWLWLFIAIGWVVTLLQALIVKVIDGKMQRILDCNDATKDDHLVGLMETLQTKMLQHEEAAAAHTAEVEKHSCTSSSSDTSLVPAETTHEKEAAAAEEKEDGEGTHKHLVHLTSAFHEGDADRIMTFRSKNGKKVADSNNIMSLRNYEVTIFFTIFLQLVIDFYLGFYVVHMRLRVRRAYGHDAMVDGDVLPQLILHALQLAPVLLTLYLLMLTTRKIALLVGVLHLNEEAVGEVLHHMEQVRGIRKRITDALVKTKAVHGEANPTKASAALLKASGEKGELAVLKALAKKIEEEEEEEKAGGGSSAVRMTRSEIEKLLEEHAAGLSFNHKECLAAYMDRDAFNAYKLLDPAHRSSAQTAHTMVMMEIGEEGSDSIEVRECARFVLCHLTDVIADAVAHQAPSSEVEALRRAITTTDLSSVVDESMLRHAHALTRAKKLFQAADINGGGSISRLELFVALRRFNCRVTQKEFNAVFRVIDPDQSHSIKLDEWIDFMSATDDGLDKRGKTKGVNEQSAAQKKRLATDVAP